ncbi:MAG: hypothetical protein CMP23_13400 [Rickettsiales bacterium]|nr:hypothetical protein [Rickettsiales bacterium]
MLLSMLVALILSQESGAQSFSAIGLELDARARIAAQAAARAAFALPDAAAAKLIYPEQDLPLRFSHRRHLELGAQCQLCHASSLTSEDVRDHNLPGHEQCGICHLMELPEAGKLYPPAACDTCHTRFVASALNGTGPAAAVVTSAESSRPQPAAVVVPPALLRFSHKLHIDGGTPCLTCHAGVPEVDLATRDQLPSMAVCLGCHDGVKAPSECTTCHLQGQGGRFLTDLGRGALVRPQGRFRPDDHHHPRWDREHASAARLAPESCSSCHSPSQCLDCHDSPFPSVDLHPADWVMTHGLDASRRSLDCQACHDRRSFCADCHERAAVTRGSFPGLLGEPQGSLRFHPVGWRGDLGEIPGPEHHSHTARRSLETCDGCHQQSECLECHSFINPHPVSWADASGAWRFGQGEGRVCSNCHRPGDPALMRL